MTHNKGGNLQTITLFETKPKIGGKKAQNFKRKKMAIFEMYLSQILYMLISWVWMAGFWKKIKNSFESLVSRANFLRTSNFYPFTVFAHSAHTTHSTTPKSPSFENSLMRGFQKVQKLLCRPKNGWVMALWSLPHFFQFPNIFIFGLTPSSKIS